MTHNRPTLLISIVILMLAGCTAAPTAAPTPLPTTTETPAPTPTLTATSKPTPQPPRAGMTLVFADEFDGSQLDAAKWQTCYPWVEEGGCTNGGNHELEWYQAENVEVADGLLRLRADQHKVSAPDGTEYPYTSGMVSSNTLFDTTYGYVEMRARMPMGRGLWPAFWLLPSTLEWPPEIDVLEVLGHDTSVVYTTLHYKVKGSPHLSSGQSFRGPDFGADFHIFAADWKPGEVIWYVDGQQVFRVTKNVPSQPMYVIANLAVGGDWPGSPDGKTVFPSYFDIDYIRVFQDASLPPTPTP